MSELKPWHIALIVLAFVVLFGYKRLPDASRSIGRSLRIFKAETKGLRGDDAPDTEHADTAPRPQVTGAPAATPAATPAAERVEARVEAPESAHPQP